MGNLIRDQQRTIDDLQKALEGETSQKPTKSHEYHNGHQLGPNSPPITWLGNTTDMLPVSVAGKSYKAMIMTETMIDALNNAFAATTVFDLIGPRYEEEVTFQEMLGELNLTEINVTQNFPEGVSEAEIDKALKDSEWRNSTFQLIWEEESKILNEARDYMEKYMWKVLKNHNLGFRKRPNFEELKELVLESKIAVRSGMKGTAGGNDMEVATPTHGSDTDD
ncbi:hypothetical protein ONS95_011903 [Cadophora gregata]|uniref:uncharacterized protein n=1 Tax=Cadophora gregata TaxID=51156 RepID=UPI0026DC1B9D|nr:uncharacterized protein ONS95_011903 [Cadophora gregata]KAK0117567.1 hypothetical protein ONS95_011903 [Cadophora gregata]